MATSVARRVVRRSRSLSPHATAAAARRRSRSRSPNERRVYAPPVRSQTPPRELQNYQLLLPEQPPPPPRSIVSLRAPSPPQESHRHLHHNQQQQQQLQQQQQQQLSSQSHDSAQAQITTSSSSDDVVDWFSRLAIADDVKRTIIDLVRQENVAGSGERELTSWFRLLSCWKNKIYCSKCITNSKNICLCVYCNVLLSLTLSAAKLPK